MSGPADVVTVLSVSPVVEDHRRLESIFSHSNWRLSRAENGQSAARHLVEVPTPVIIIDAVLPDRSWISLLELCAGLPQPTPRVIVASRLADDGLWQQVLDHGGYNVLQKPFDSREVFWVVRHAWLDWRSELERVTNAGCRSMAAGA